jgi:hypothetical protein
MEFWSDVLLSPIIIISALVIGTIGEVVKRIIRLLDPMSLGSKVRQDVTTYTGWRRVYYVTLPAHPVLVGVGLGFMPWLPAHDALTKPGFELAGHIGTYALAGVVCKIGYDTLVSTIKRVIASKAKSLDGSSSDGSSEPPPADSDASTTPPA